MKKTIALLLGLVMVIAMFAACDSGTKPVQSPDESKPVESVVEPSAPAAGGTLNVFAFTDEVPKMLAQYKVLNPDFPWEFNCTIIATTDGLYEPALDEALAAGGGVDIYCAEAAFVKKYTQGDMADFAMPYEDLGIDVAGGIAAAKIAQYSVDIGTNKDGKVVGLGYQATGGAMIYRRSIAKELWGTDAPADVAAKVGPGWDKFFAAAGELKAKGYAIVSGDGDIWHSIENGSDYGWLNADNKLVIDPKREQFLDYSKQLKDSGYHNDTQDWTEQWYADMGGKGPKQVFSFFGPAWLINYVMAGNSGGKAIGEGTYGDWAICAPPVPFFWGGTWLLAANDLAAEKKDAVKTLINWITLQCDKDGLQYAWANGTLFGEGGTKDCVASETVMAMSNGELPFLGGQNMFDVFVPANAAASAKNLTQYDQSINNEWRDQVRQYSGAKKDKATAIADFKAAVKSKYGIDAA